MEDLIKALQILLQYGNPKYPTSCTHDELIVNGIDVNQISEADVSELERLGFMIDKEGEYNEENDYTPDEDKIYSFRYGSC